ncbi:hypothetical protein F4802DRAFT_607535 [Xylaria palmicola]|nr:hypothetical protein F4802DRAFT_607535 [Xylaria palmicola]
MAPDSFHQFPLLPFELRRMIYLLASPPRFVHVQEALEDREAFKERLRTTPAQLHLHPSIAYFAHNWRARIPSTPGPGRAYGRQLALEAYGLSGPPPRHQPWASTKETPGIPHHFLSENGHIAWEFVRSGCFYSTAPIPPLLHVTIESRQVLVNYGYELAFPTRTCGPRIWFNFRTDVLYISRFEADWDDSTFHSVLSGNDWWDIGQFEPQDMKRVRRLALGASAYVVSRSQRDGLEGITNILTLFTNVEELFFEENSSSALSDKFSDNARRNDRQLWTYTSVQEVDVLSDAFEGECSVYSTGYNHADLKAYKAENLGHGNRFFVDTARIIGEKLALRKEELIRRESLAPWTIPKINIVYIGYPWVCEGLFNWRRDMWNQLQLLKEEHSKAQALEEAQRSIDIPRRPIHHTTESPLSPFSEQFQDDLEAYEDLYGDGRLSLYGGYDEFMENQQRLAHRRWLLSVTIASPEIQRNE